MKNIIYKLARCIYLYIEISSTRAYSVRPIQCTTDENKVEDAVIYNNDKNSLLIFKMFIKSSQTLLKFFKNNNGIIFFVF